MKKIMIGIISLISILCIFCIGKSFYRNYQIRHAKKVVILKEQELEVFSDVKLKDLIQSMNGTLIKNEKINTTEIGEQEITFEYITDQNIKVPYTIHIYVVDRTPPIIYQPSSYTVEEDSMTKKELAESLFCGDNYDDHPKCTIEGDYNLKEIGTYPVTFKGEDSSGNISNYSFNLIVKEKIKNSKKSNTTTNHFTSYTDFQDIIKNYKKKNTKIGIDVSHWQGKIDFEKVKKSGIEFVYIRVGRGDGIGEKYVLDDRFEEYIKGFNKVKIPVGIYFYSNANSEEDAKKEAKWVLSKIKKYKLDLEIAFDWENWNYYQEYDLSFYHLTQVAKAFIDTVEKEGYHGMLYSSKHNLETIWYPINTNIWLAHYTKNTNYEGSYKVWQICEDGKVDGIDDNLVDINIRYNKKGKD